MARYHTNAISTVEVMQELIALAKDVRAARKRGEDEGLSQDEIAFYDALAESESAVELMGNESLKLSWPRFSSLRRRTWALMRCASLWV
jgi:type I restriction enzyme R subunit